MDDLEKTVGKKENPEHNRREFLKVFTAGAAGGALAGIGGMEGGKFLASKLAQRVKAQGDATSYERFSALVSLEPSVMEILAKRHDTIRLNGNNGAIGLVNKSGNHSFYKGAVDLEKIEQIYGRLDPAGSVLIFEYKYKNGESETLYFRYDFLSGDLVVEESGRSNNGGNSMQDKSVPMSGQTV